MPTAVVTGANSGIGHAFAALLIKEGYDVHALDMHLDGPIQSLGCPCSSVDLTNPTSIADFASAWGPTKPIDLLLNIAGIMAPPEEDALHTSSFVVLSATFATNAFGPFLLTQALLPNLLAAPKPAKLAVMSSRVGSIADNGTGGSYAYRGSKAAVNALFKSLAVDLKGEGVAVAVLHPGITRTNIADVVREEKDAWRAEDVVEKLWVVLKGVGLEQTGRFWHRDGYELPW